MRLSRIKAAGAIVAIAAVSLIAWPASALADCTDGPAAGGDWPVFQHDVTATGFQPAESTIGPDNVGDLEVAWATPIEGAIESPAVADGGCVFIGTESGAIYALDITDGQLVWKASLPVATTLSVGSGKVFVQSGSMITALDESTGAIVWQQDFAPYSSIGSPLATDEFVVFGMSGCSDFGSRGLGPCKGYYALLDPDSGDILVDGFDVSDEDVAEGMEGPGFWSHPSYDPEDKYVYFGTANVRSIAPENPYSNALLKIDADPLRDTYGEIVGHFHNLPPNPIHDYPGGKEVCGPSPASLAVSLACIDDDDFPSTAVIYRDSDGNKRLGVTHSGADIPFRTYASFAVPVGYYFGIDPDTMEEVWSAPTTAARATVSAYDGEQIYYASGTDGNIIAVDKDNGEIAWQAQTFGTNMWQHVSAANGVVYVPSGAAGHLASVAPGMLLAFDAEDGTPLLQRPISQDIGDIARGTVSGGVTIARNTVIIPTNAVGSAAYLVAYRLPS